MNEENYRVFLSLIYCLSLRSWNLISVSCFTIHTYVILDRLIANVYSVSSLINGWNRKELSKFVSNIYSVFYPILLYIYKNVIESFVHHIHPVLPVSQIFVINNAGTSNALCSWRIPDRLQKLNQVFSGGVCLQTST